MQCWNLHDILLLDVEITELPMSFGAKSELLFIDQLMKHGFK